MFVMYFQLADIIWDCFKLSKPKNLSYLPLGKKIDMTAPVLVKMVDKRFWEMGVYTMSFLLPADHQMNPPKPTDDKASKTHQASF